MAYNIPTRRIAAGAGPQGLNLQILPLHERNDFNASAMNQGDLVFVLVDVFTTHNGSWDVGAQPEPYGIERWARDAYLFPPSHPRYNPSGGGDHNSFASCLDLAGNPYPDAGFVWTSNGAQHLQPPVDPNMVVTRNGEPTHGWANIPIFNNVQPGGQGWAVAKFGAADILQGIGLPNNWHVSTFAVWRAMTWRDYAGVNPPPPNPEPQPEPTTDLDLLVTLAVPQMAGTRAPSTIAQRSLDTLRLLREGAGNA